MQASMRAQGLALALEGAPDVFSGMFLHDVVICRRQWALIVGCLRSAVGAQSHASTLGGGFVPLEDDFARVPELPSPDAHIFALLNLEQRQPGAVC